MRLSIDCSRAMKQLKKDLDNFSRKQLPFATSMALNSLAAGVKAQETAALSSTFKNPTPFTLRAYGLKTASKASPVASVFAKDVQSQYLQPFETGGSHFLSGKKGVLVPKNVSLNQYGNLTKGMLKTLKGRPDIFIGSVVGKNGDVIRGVWQRQTAAQVHRAIRRGKRAAPDSGIKVKGGLKLLIRFGDALPVEEHLDFHARAEAYINKNMDRAFREAFANAMRSAR